MIEPGPSRADVAPIARTIQPQFARLSLYAWGAVGIIAVGLGLLWLLGQIWVVVLALVIAAMLTRILEPVAARLRPRTGRTIAALATLSAVLVLMSAAIAGVGAVVGSETDALAASVTSAIDDVENWLVEDGPIDITRADVEQFRQDTGDGAGRWFRSSGDSLIAGVVFAGELLLSGLLGVLVTFFLLKDGRRFTVWAHGRLPARRRELAARLGARAWQTIGGYLRGAAILGLLEGTIAGLTLTLVGGQLGVPVAVITFLLAFIPFAGAIAAGLLAVLVALATAGGTAALIVGIVMFTVQQLDNDLLAPVVYGHQLDVHPVVIVFSIIGGGALFGAAGSALAVPVTAVLYNLVIEASRDVATPPGSEPQPERSVQT